MLGAILRLTADKREIKDPPNCLRQRKKDDELIANLDKLRVLGK